MILKYFLMMIIAAFFKEKVWASDDTDINIPPSLSSLLSYYSVNTGPNELNSIDYFNASESLGSGLTYKTAWMLSPDPKKDHIESCPQLFLSLTEADSQLRDRKNCETPQEAFLESKEENPLKDEEVRFSALDITPLVAEMGFRNGNEIYRYLQKRVNPLSLNEF